jgi:hypothetical protein
MKLVKESLNNKKIKSFEDVQIGDSAFSYGEKEFEGHILAKGTFDELYKKYQSTWTREDLEEEELEWLEEEMEECVAVSQDPKDTLEQYTSIIYVYNYDPITVVVYK